MANIRVLKATSGNAVKRLKIRQDTRVASRASKNAEATIKQIATQELQAEKGRMQEWKRYVMQEVAQELQAIRPAQDEVIEAQRQSFQTELERIREKPQHVELRSKTLEDEIKTLKAKEKAPEYSPAPSTQVVEETQAMPSSSKVISGGKAVKPPPKSYAQIAAANTAQNPLEKAWTEITSSSCK